MAGTYNGIVTFFSTSHELFNKNHRSSRNWRKLRVTVSPLPFTVLIKFRSRPSIARALQKVTVPYFHSRKRTVRDRAKTGFVATSGIWPLREGGGWTKSVKCVTNSTLRFHEEENADTRYFISIAVLVKVCDENQMIP